MYKSEIMVYNIALSQVLKDKENESDILLISYTPILNW